jgi:CubicO group peptidase (beta-lactamase class C family)
MRIPALVVSVWAVLACATAKTHSGAAAPVSEDTPLTTAGGATLIVPAGWSVATIGRVTRLSGPEPGLMFAVTDNVAPTADDAVSQALPLLDPAFHWPLKRSQPWPGRDGWEEERSFVYQTSPNEKLTVGVNAWRKGDQWNVFLFEGQQAPWERRGAQISRIFESMRPKGYVKESFAGREPHALGAERVQRIVAMVDQGRRALDIPGVALSLVQDGKVVFEGGLGVRELGRPDKVDADTLFMIASNTKALSTLLLAIEVDEGRFKWSTPVTQVYPAFKLGDANTTSSVLMKHLVCACTGMPRQDLEWVFGFQRMTPEAAMGMLGGMQPTTKFGETFQYSNLMAAAAGFIGGAVAEPNTELGKAYDRTMQTRVFEPLGMSRTTFDFQRALTANHASPHSEDFEGHMQVARSDTDREVIPVRPAGGAWSSVRDLRQYVQMELAEGKLPDGRRLVSQESLLERRKPQARTGEYSTYGMGLFVSTEWKIPVVHHGGDLDGYHSDMFWLPDQHVGGVIFTNADGGWALRGPFVRKVLEELFDGKPEALEDLLASAQSRKAALSKERARLTLPPDPAVVAMLAARYTCPELGHLAVRREGAAVEVDTGGWHTAVASRKNDDGTYSIVAADPPILGLPWLIANGEKGRRLIVRDGQHEYSFVEAR